MYKQWHSTTGSCARAVCWLLVLFYVLAASRGFIPGLCATLNTVNAEQEAAECRIVERGATSCCVSRTAPSDEEKGASDLPPAAPQDGHCPFCTLLTSRSQAPCVVSIPAPVAPAFAPPVPLKTVALEQFLTRAVQDRAPPA